MAQSWMLPISFARTHSILLSFSVSLAERWWRKAGGYTSPGSDVVSNGSILLESPLEFRGVDQWLANPTKVVVQGGRTHSLTLSLALSLFLFLSLPLSLSHSLSFALSPVLEGDGTGREILFSCSLSRFLSLSHTLYLSHTHLLTHSLLLEGGGARWEVIRDQRGRQGS